MLRLVAHFGSEGVKVNLCALKVDVATEGSQGCNAIGAADHLLLTFQSLGELAQDRLPLIRSLQLGSNFCFAKSLWKRFKCRVKIGVSIFLLSVWSCVKCVRFRCCSEACAFFPPFQQANFFLCTFRDQAVGFLLWCPHLNPEPSAYWNSLQEMCCAAWLRETLEEKRGGNRF